MLEKRERRGREEGEKRERRGKEEGEKRERRGREEGEKRGNIHFVSRNCLNLSPFGKE